MGPLLACDPDAQVNVEQRSGGPLADLPVTVLSKRERCVFLMISEGLTAKEIALKLTISPKTVEFHKTNISRKTGFHHPVQMVRYAIRAGLVQA